MDTSIAEQAVERVFPRTCQATRKAGEVAPACRFWIVSGRNGPRWIVPQNQRDGWPALRHWRPYGVASRRKWTVLTAAYRAGRLGHLPGVVALGIAGAGDADWRHLGWTGAGSLAPVIYIGSPGPTRKAVATLVASDSHMPIGVAKAPLGPDAAHRIIREAEILQRLADEKPGLAPRLLFLDRSRGCALQEFVSGRPAGRRLTKAHLRWQDDLRVSGETSLRMHVDRLRERLARAGLADGTAGDIVSRTLDSIDDAAPLQAVRVHGDFAPWNVMRRGDGSLRAIDWESCESPGLPLQDIFHYLYIQLFLLGSPKDVLGNLAKMAGFSGFLDSLNIGRRTCLDLALFFLADNWVYRSEIGDTRHAAFLASELQALAHRVA